MATNPLEAKIALFGDLLKEVFAGHQVYEMPVGDRSSHLFRIDHGGTIAHRIYVSREFFGDHRDEEIWGSSATAAWRTGSAKQDREG
jgi:hypothetical protein